jgi:CRISPR-associated DxTHG motif protein
MEGLRPSVTRLDITAGFTENDIWSIFDSVYGALQDMDEIYLDVTHAFRSIPLFSIPLFNFAKFMKQTRLVAIYYGAFEARQNQIAPIVDLTSLVKLQATNVAASNFVDFGKVGSLNIAIDENHLNEAGQEVIHAVQDVKRQLEALDYYIQTCNMNRLRQGEYYRVIHERIDTVCGSPHVREAETLLLRKMLAELDAFHFTCEASDCNVVGAIKWAIKYNMIQQAYTLGEEYMINRVAIYIRKGFSELDIDSGIAQNAEARREFAGNVLAAPANRNFRITQTRYQVGNADRNELEAYGQRLLADRHIATVRMSYNQIRDNRNQLNHANGLEARNVNQAPAVVMGRLKEQLNLTIDMFNQFPLNG